MSGGESQRIRLATQIGSRLTGVLYILDEPSIGLHQRDNRKLLDALTAMRDQGNTVIVVEHDEETIRTADWVVDLGPGAGELGGTVVATGTAGEIEKHEESLTGAYLSGRERIDVPTSRRAGNGKAIRVVGAAQHNLMLAAQRESDLGAQVLGVGLGQRAGADDAVVDGTGHAPLEQRLLTELALDVVEQRARGVDTRERRRAPVAHDLGIGEDRVQRLDIGGDQPAQAEMLRLDRR